MLGVDTFDIVDLDEFGRTISASNPRRHHSGRSIISTACRELGRERREETLLTEELVLSSR